MTPGSRINRRRHIATAAMLVALMAAPLHAAWAAAPAAATPQTVLVTLDRAKLIKMPDHVDTIVVGSPIIADVTMLKKNGLVVLTGKGYGETNVIFLDAAGQALSEIIVSVQHQTGLLTVQRGLDRESYACTPRCEPSVALGDATKYIQDTSTQITARNGLAGTAK